MPMVFWAAQTIAASTLLGVGATTLNIYISPTSAASKIQQAYRFYRIRRNRLLLPGLRGPCTSRPGSPVATEEWAAQMNAYYRSALALMHRSWATLPLADLVSYFSVLRGLNQSLWPPYSVDWKTFHRESHARHMVLKLTLKSMLDILGRPVSWLKFSSSGLHFFLFQFHNFFWISGSLVF